MGLGLGIVLGAGVAAGQPAAPAPAPARATPSRPTPAPDAPALYAEGVRHYDAGEYAAAIAVWQQAYALSQAPLLLFNIAQAYRKQGDCRTAMTFYRKYLAIDPEPKNKATVDSVMAMCAGAEEPVSDHPVDHPVVTPVVIAPAAHHDDRAAPRPGRREQLAGLIVVGAGLVVGATGLGFAYEANAIGRRVERRVGPWSAGLEASQARGKRDDVIGASLLAVGFVGLAVGGTLLVLGKHAEDRHDSLALVPSGDGLAIAGEF